MSKAARQDYRNVINFAEIQGERKPAYYPPLLLAGKSFALDFLAKSLKTLFNNADDSLFEYADKALNNNQQTFYFDAMRELRVQREPISDGFFQAFELLFRNIVEGMDSSEFDWQAQSPAGGLSLVPEDDLEINLAIVNMEQRIQAECREQLSGLIYRLNELGCVQSFNRNSHPFSPQSVCESFNKAVEHLGFELEIQLILYKLFDKFVVRDMNQLYSGINDIFVKAGIMPNIRYRIPPIQSAGNASRERADETSQAAISSPIPNPISTAQRAVPAAMAPLQDNGDLFAVMRRLIAAPAGGLGLGGPVAPAGMAATSEIGYIPIEEAVDQLSGLQTSRVWQALPHGSNTLQQIQKVIYQQAGDRQFSRVETDTINIVTMMFDMILDDEQIPQDIKTQINRLQIPYIKVAMLDKSFFNDKKHPARLLLNDMARSFETLDADETQYQPLYQKIVAVVDTVIENFKTDVKLFADLLKEFRAFVKEEQSINQHADKLLLKAKERAAAELEKRIADHKLPRHLLQFLLGPWKEVLTRVALKEQHHPGNWKRYVRCIDQLIWSVQGKASRMEQQALADLLPDLLAQVRSGLAIAQVDTDEQEHVFKELQDLHIAALKVEHSAKLANFTDSDPNKKAEIDFWDDIEAQNVKHEDYQKELMDMALTSSPYFNKVKDMAMGTWVTFDNGTKKSKGKLCWRCDFTGEYIFMTRLYKVVADLNFKTLIEKLEKGEAQIAEELPLFDRAVNAIFRKVSQQKLELTTS